MSRSSFLYRGPENEAVHTKIRTNIASVERHNLRSWSQTHKNQSVTCRHS